MYTSLLCLSVYQNTIIITQEVISISVVIFIIQYSSLKKNTLNFNYGNLMYEISKCLKYY